MLSTTHFSRSTTRLAVIFPLVLLATACSDDDEVQGFDPAGASGSGNAGRSGSAGASGSGGAGNGGNGNGGASGNAGSSAADTTAPSVVSTFPDDDATGESINAVLSVTFSEAMDPLTLTNATFTVEQDGLAVTGVVSYSNRAALFLPAANLELNTTYTATVTTAAEDRAGNALEEAYSWTFETDATLPIGPAPVLLGAAGEYVILAKTAISNVPTSTITGNLGLSPAAASYITGFALTRAGTEWTSPEVTGGIFAANNDPPTPSDLTTAIGAMETAYTDAAGRPTPEFLDLGAGAIGGLTLTPGLYKWASTVTIPTDVTISGAPNDVWIFQISGDLTMSADKNITLDGGARPKNIFWQVAGSVDVGTDSHFEGVILSQTAINLGTGTSINGRLLAQTAVSIAGTTVTAPSE